MLNSNCSARIWTIQAEKEGINVCHAVGPVLFGHTARVWDCCVADSVSSAMTLACLFFYHLLNFVYCWDTTGIHSSWQASRSVSLLQDLTESWIWKKYLEDAWKPFSFYLPFCSFSSYIRSSLFSVHLSMECRNYMIFLSSLFIQSACLGRFFYL